MRRSLPTGRCLCMGLLLMLPFMLKGQGMSAGSYPVLAKNSLPQQAAARKSLKLILEELEDKFHVSFGYLDDDIENVFIENVSTNGSLEEVLYAILQPLNLRYVKMQENFYLIQSEKGSRKSKRANTEASEKLQASINMTPVAQASATARALHFQYHEQVDFEITGKVT